MTALCLMIPACRPPGLSHEQNMAKMRLLTFMGMAVEFKEISFDTMQQELQIGAEDVEAFVIDGISPQIKHFLLTMKWKVVSNSFGQELLHGIDRKSQKCLLFDPNTI